MAVTIGRRELLAAFSGAVATWPLAAQAQQAERLPTIGFLGAGTLSTYSPWAVAFMQRLRELGWIEGRNIAIEYRWADGRNERYSEIATEFSRLRVDVIVTTGTGAVIAAKQATASIPIVFTRETRSPPAWSQVWRNREATSPGCRTSCPMLPASGSNSCAKLFPIFADWQS